MAVRYSLEKQLQIVDLYNSGLSIKKIADQLNAGRNAVHRCLKERGIDTTMRVRKFDDETEAKIAEEYKTLKSSYLGIKYNCDPDVIVAIVKRRGGKVRHRGACRRLVSDNPAIREQVRTLWSQGLTKTMIANKTKTYFWEIAKILGEDLGISEEEINKRKYCGALMPNFQTGKKKAGRGYISVRIYENDPYFCMSQRGTNVVLEHRYVMAKHLGRPLEQYETVHHINGDKTDNRLENLQLHTLNHGIGIRHRCNICGSEDIQYIPFDNTNSKSFPLEYHI